MNFNIDMSKQIDIENWEIDPNNVDIGGCMLLNPMDVLNQAEVQNDVSRTVEDDMNGSGDDFGLGFGDTMDDSVFDGDGHVGMISEIDEESMSLVQADRVVDRISIAYANQATQIDIQDLKVRLYE